MGVAAVATDRIAKPMRRGTRGPVRTRRRTGPRRVHTITRFSGIDTFPVWTPRERKTFWDRAQDDGELIGLKVVVLVSLFLLTAILELVA